MGEGEKGTKDTGEREIGVGDGIASTLGLSCLLFFFPFFPRFLLVSTFLLYLLLFGRERFYQLREQFPCGAKGAWS